MPRICRRESLQLQQTSTTAGRKLVQPQSETVRKHRFQQVSITYRDLVRNLWIRVVFAWNNVSVANSRSCGRWCLVQAATVFLPTIRFEVHALGFGRFDRSLSLQPRMNSVSVVVTLEGRQFQFQICRRPEQKMVEAFTTNRSILWRSPLCGAEARAAHQLEWSLGLSAT